MIQQVAPVSLSRQIARLQSGEVSAEQLLCAQLDSTLACNPRINALIYQAEKDSLLEQARQSDDRRQAGQVLSNLDGISLAIKDNIHVAGMPTTVGLGLTSCQATEDADVVTRARQAGMLIVGKLNMHEAALGATTDNPHLGACHHPLRQDYTPGGSSGGSGAWVGAGMGAAALGTDTLGSVRIPAAYCGVSGIKPTSGWISDQGLMPLYRQLDTIGPLAAEPADLSPLLAMLSGRQAKPCRLQKKLLWIDNLAGLAPEVAQHLAKTRVQLAEGGYNLKSGHLGELDLGLIRRAGLLLSELEMLANYQDALKLHPQAFSPALCKMLNWAKQQPDSSARQARALLAATSQAIASLFAGYDWLLLPTTGQTAFAFSAPAPVQQADYTAPFSVSGHPALSFPAGFVNGLPVGLQLVGQPDSDFALIEQAQQLFNILNGRSESNE